MSDFLPLAFKASHFNISDQVKFEEALSLLKESLICKGSTLFSGDNMLLWNKSYSFLRQEKYLTYVSSKLTPAIPKTIIWRTHVLDYFLKRSLNVEGEILELGVLKGATAKFLCDLNSEKIIDRRYILIDLFDWKSGDKHTAHEALKEEGLYEKVRSKFAAYKFIEVIQGDVTKALPSISLGKVAFAHIDMNSAEPELFSLNYLIPRMARGGAIVLDDYGWFAYAEQTVAINKLLSKFNLEILELPTGQGVLIF